MNMSTKNVQVKKVSGFSLVELLVVISIIAVIVGLALPNFLGARQRARDAKRKAELVELKQALRLYYNDYQNYPAAVSGNASFAGCGTNGTSDCPVCTTAEFSAGGATGCNSVYMKRFPKDTAGVNAFVYYQYSSGEDFRLVVRLENASDSELTASQSRCPPSSGAWNPLDYVQCAD